MDIVRRVIDQRTFRCEVYVVVVPRPLELVLFKSFDVDEEIRTEGVLCSSGVKMKFLVKTVCLEDVNSVTLGEVHHTW